MRTLTLEEDKESLEGSVVFGVDLGKWSEHTRGSGQTGYIEGDIGKQNYGGRKK